MAATAEFFTKPVPPQSARISTANTNRDGTGTVGTFATGVTGGRMVNRIVVQALGPTTVGAVRIFLYDGTNYRAYREVPVTVVNSSQLTAGAVAFRAEFAVYDLVLASSSITLVASTHNAESFDVIAFCGDAE
jgi:hypothetical protein